MKLVDVVVNVVNRPNRQRCTQYQHDDPNRYLCLLKLIVYNILVQSLLISKDLFLRSIKKLLRQIGQKYYCKGEKQSEVNNKNTELYFVERCDS